MYFIDKITLGKKLYISPQYQDMIKYPQQFSLEEKQDLFRLLNQYKYQCWIACDCNAPHSLLVICVLRDYIYIRCKSKNTHLPSCHFFLVGTITLNSSTPKTIVPDARLLKYNLYHTPSQFKGTSTSQNKNGPINSRSISKLGQALYTIITDSKINVINTALGPISLFDQLKNITSSFDDPRKLIGKNIALKQFYRYSLTPQTLQSSEGVLIKATSSFPKGLKPFMLFTAIATTITNNSFTTKSNTSFTVNKTISLPSTWIDITKSAPYFLMASALLDSDMKVFLNDAFALPIYSMNLLMPLESNFERTILKIIFKLTSKIKDLIIEKPLICLQDEDKNKYRPDFIISSSNGKTIYIEVLGSTNELYLSHKSDMHDRAKQYCTYFLSVKAYDLQKEYERFTSSLQQALTQLAGKN